MNKLGPQSAHDAALHTYCCVCKAELRRSEQIECEPRHRNGHYVVVCSTNRNEQRDWWAEWRPD